MARNDPSAQIALGRDPDTMRQLDQLKSDYMNVTDSNEKGRLKQDVEGIEDSLRDAMGDAALPKKAFDWRVAMAEIFANGGFDIVIGNPPYAQILKGTYSAQQFPYSEGKDRGKQNLYKLFVERSYQLCKAGGVATLIVQSSLMCDLSSAATRQLLLERTQLRHIIEFP